MRKHGMVVGIAIQAERKRAPDLSPASSKPSSTSPVAAPHANANVSVKVAKLDSPANHAVDSTEVAHLKRVLTAMTAPAQAPAKIAGAGSKDSMVSPTSGQKPRTATNTKSTGSGSP